MALCVFTQRKLMNNGSKLIHFEKVAKNIFATMNHL